MLKRYVPLKEAVGKKAGSALYIHKSALDTLTGPKKERVDQAKALVPKNFKWNFVVIDPAYISFVDAEDFDNTYEPVLGARYKVKDGQASYVSRASSQPILHQRYKTVKPNYKGFDIEDDKNREKWYRQFFDAKAMYGAGYKHNWEKMLSELPEKYVNSEPY
jgi:hypothetical protein